MTDVFGEAQPGIVAVRIANPPAFDRRTVEQAAVDSNATLPVTRGLVDVANRVLEYLTSLARGNQDWWGVVQATLPEARAKQTLTTVNIRRQNFNFGQPIGAIASGTGIVREKLGYSSEQTQLALQLLKTTGRIAQGGVGRGKCIVVISNEPLEADVFNLHEVQPIMETDPIALLDLVRQSLLTEREQLQAQVEEAKTQVGQVELIELRERVVHLQQENETLVKTVEEQRGQLKEREDVFKAVERQLAERTAATWL